MTLNSGSGSTRRDLLKMVAAAGAGALLPWERVASAQAPKRGKIDVHSHTRPQTQGQQNGTPWTPQATIEQMDKYGISISILSAINASRDPFYSGKPEARDLVRASNEYHAKLAHDFPKRFGFFVNLPWSDPDGSLKEIEYAYDTLKPDGVGLWTSTPDKKYPGMDMFKPVMDELNRRKAVVFIHPAAPMCCQNLDPPVTGAMGEFDFDVTRVAESLLVHGTFEQCPDIQFIFPHSGGTVPMLAGRIKDRVTASKRPDLKPHVYDLLRKQHYEIAHAAFPFPFAALTKLVPTSQIMFGTDYPAEPVASTMDEIPGLGLSAETLEAIYHGNAERLFPRLKAIT
jgi:6-methylsalicylate decarboxylase